MKILVVQSRPYQAFAGGDGAYIDALVRHLDQSGNQVIGITSGTTKGRPRAWVRLAYACGPKTRWKFRSTIRLGDFYLALSAQLVTDTVSFLRQKFQKQRRPLSAFAVSPSQAERSWIARELEREAPDVVILTFESAGVIDIVKAYGSPVVALVGFLPLRGYSLDPSNERQTETSPPLKTFLDAVRHADTIAFSSRDDCFYARNELGITAPIFVGMGFSMQSLPPQNEAKDLLFVGNKTAANREAVDWFIKNVWPNVRERVPEASFRIVGRVANYFTSSEAEGITCVGEVSSLASEYQRARLVVAPLLSGSAGVKTKIAEAISFGCPVITTSLGVDGGDADQISGAGYIADDHATFTDHAVALLTDNKLWHENRLGTNAVFQKLFSFDAAYGEIDTALTRLAAASRSAT